MVVMVATRTAMRTMMAATSDDVDGVNADDGDDDGDDDHGEDCSRTANSTHVLQRGKH